MQVSIGHSPVHGLRVQKLHEILPNAVLGFAGSVAAGFRCLAAVRDSWQNSMQDGRRDPNLSMSDVCNKLRANIKNLTSDGDVDLLIAALAPDPIPGLPNGYVGIHQGSVFVTRSRSDFIVAGVQQFKVGGIGSGASVDKYARGLEQAFRDPNGVLELRKFEQTSKASSGSIVAHIVGQFASEGLEPTVGDDLHFAVVARDAIFLGTNEHWTGRVLGKVPGTWEELCLAARGLGMHEAQLHAMRA